MVNASTLVNEPLAGLSEKAIKRWAVVNRIEEQSAAFQLLAQISGSLFFLASQSQEQVSSKYQANKSELARLSAELDRILNYK